MNKFNEYYQGCGGHIFPDDIKVPIGDFYVEEKYDGIWCAIYYDEAGEVSLMSRNCKEKNNNQLQSLIEYLEGFNLKNTVLAGELMFGSQRATDYAKKHGHHKVFIFDVLFLYGECLYDKFLFERKKILEELFESIGKFIVLDETFAEMSPYTILTFGNDKKLELLYKEAVDAGKEGLVLKRDSSKYTPGTKPKDWYKLKKEVTEDYVIIGYSETESADFASKGWIGGLNLGLFRNDVLSYIMTVGSMSFEWREKFSKNKDKYLGSVVECKGFEKFHSGALRHPSFLRVREDKDKKDCNL